MPASSLLGTAMASIVGTTGAAMILIRPLIRANAARAHNVHVVVFFIFLVANIGGALSPLGDPPLFVGFLRGVDFFWTTTHLACCRPRSSPRWCWPSSSRSISGSRAAKRTAGARRGRAAAAARPDQPAADRLHHRRHPAVGGLEAGRRVRRSTAPHVALQNLVRDGALIVIALASLWLTPDEHRTANDFTWEPIARGGQAVRRHFRLHHSGAGDAGGRPRRAVRLAARRGHRA